MDFNNKKVAVLGLGIEGISLCQFLLGRGARVTILDHEDREVLLARLEGEARHDAAKILDDKRIEAIFGQEYLDNLKVFDLILRSPSIYFNDAKILEAREAGIIISSQMELFFELCPCRIIGVTGTKGKGTTASLIFEILKKNIEYRISNIEKDSQPSNIQTQDSRFRGNDKEVSDSTPNVHLAGNIGYPAITLLGELKAEDIVVLELSNFQLADMTRSPHLAIVMNLTEDHLDYHKDVEEYRKAKFNILKFQSGEDSCVLNSDSTFNKSWLAEVMSTKLYFSDHDQSGLAYVGENSDGTLAVFFHKDGEKIEICSEKNIKLIGRHNLANIAAATVVANILKVPVEVIRTVTKSFIGLPHRLEFVGEIDGVKYINDSFATNPGPTSAAIDSFKENKILILGGSEKGADFTELAREITEDNVRAVVSIGVEGLRISLSLKDAHFGGKVIEGKQNIEEIVSQAQAAAQPGDVVIFSPACASFDMFKNYKDRGEKFKTAVLNLGSPSKFNGTRI